jgi:DNA damage-binding protein 1
MRYDYDDALNLFPINMEDIDNSKTQTFGFLKVVSNGQNDSKNIFLDVFSPINNKQEFREIMQSDLSFNPTVTLMFSPKIGGLVVFYSNYLKYYRYGNNLIEKDTKTYTDRRFLAYAEIDKNRYIVGDEFGNIFLLAFKSDSIIFQFLGEVNYISNITYIDNNFVFIGSTKSNSQLIRIVKQNTNIQNRPFIEIVEEYDNLAPIFDFTIFNSNEESNTEILCISGIDKTCSLKSIRKGTSLDIYGEININGLKTVYPIHLKNDNSMDIDDNDNKQILMLLAFVDRTAVYIYDQSNNTIKECQGNISDNFTNETTHFACSYEIDGANYILHISNSHITIFDCQIRIIKKISTVVEPSIIKYKRKSQMLYIYNSNNLMIRYNVKSLTHDTDVHPEILSYDLLISAFDVTGNIMIFSTWDSNKIYIYSLNNKKINQLHEYDDSLFANSIAFVKNDGIKFLFIALSNGKMLYYKLKRK